jgi:zinc/manganese transport system permease protein
MTALELLWIPFLLALVLTGIHGYLGLHVLARKIVFVDLALAQIAALGATVAFMLGYAPQTTAAYGYSLAFTLAGAVLLSFSRRWTGTHVSQEAIVGVIYVVSAAAAVVLIDQAPQGAEHLKQLLTGSILTATTEDLVNLTLLYALIGAIHWLCRRPLLRVSFDHNRGAGAEARLWWWDFLFYALFGVVVTSSVAVAGVLLVFSFLIIPALIGTLYAKRLGIALMIGWVVGGLSSAAGLAVSYGADLPTGAAMVCVFGLSLALAAALKPVLSTRAASRRASPRALSLFFARAVLAVGFVSALWLVAYPQADQPLLDLLEHHVPGLRAPFLSAAEEETLRQSYLDEDKARQEAARLNEKERSSRWQGESLSDDEVRRITSYSQSFLEMTKGERVVQRALRDKARERQRWVLGVPVLLFCVAGFLLLPGRVRVPVFTPNPESIAAPP